MISNKKQSGLTTVEFAIVAVVLLTAVLAVIDISRLYFTVAALNEATRRGARVAAVCPVDDPAIAQAAVFNALGETTSSTIIGGLETQHIDVEYLDTNGASVASTAENIAYVRVRINGGFQLRTFIPGLPQIIPVPDFAATLPAESLGWTRESETAVPC